MLWNQNQRKNLRVKNKSTFYLVVPSFNQAVYLKECLESIVSQAGVEVVCLVKDGGSSDESVTVLKTFGSKIEWSSRKDKGQSDALNQGLREVWQRSKSEADIFAYLNSDDYYQPQALVRVLTAFAKHPERAWLVGDAQIVDGQGGEIQSSIRRYKRVWRQVLSWPLLLILNPIPQPAVFLKVSATRLIGEFNQELNYTMDYEYWLRALQLVGPPIKLNSTLAAFRIHSLSKGSTAFLKQFHEQYLVARRFTQNPAWLLGQRLHNKLIVSVYSILK
jgi:glycosyltransferase involved in cell wall biosynthesis